MSSFNQYLIENINIPKITRFQTWLDQARKDFPRISIEDAEILLDTQEGVAEYIRANYPDSEESESAILMRLINQEV